MKRKSVRRRKDTPIKEFKRFRLHHKIIFSALGMVGVVAIWRGVWNLLHITPSLSHPITSLVFGLLLVIISGFFFKLM